jgi:hypothetical protein
MSTIQPTADQLLTLTTIDRKRKVKTIIQLRDSEGDEIPVKETVEKLTEYITDKLKDSEENACKSQILPLMGQAITAGLTKYAGVEWAAYLLTDEVTRGSMATMMCMSFYLLKWIQQKGIKIHTIEEDITDEEIEMYDRCSKASSITTKYAMAGGDPKKALREMLKRGLIKEQDLAHMGAESMVDEESTDEPEKDPEKN